MSERESWPVEGEGGACGSVRFPAGSDQVHAELTLNSGQRLLVARSALIRKPDGSYFLPIAPAELNQATEAVAVMPVVREEIKIEKTPVESERVIVRVVPTKHRQLVDVPLVQEQIEVERVPMNRFVEHPVPVREEGQVTIIPVMEEVLVVEKRLRVKEEIRLIRRKSVRHEPHEVELRTEEAHVERAMKKT